MSGHPQLAALLARLSYKEGDFTLASGAKSTFYLDAKQVTYHPDGAPIVGAAVHALARDLGATAVGGPTLGADAIVLASVVASAGTDHPLTGFIVRKDAKKHGLGKWVEGVIPEGKKVVVVEDVVTSGGSLLKAVEHVREAGARIVVATAVVDREQGGRAAIEAAGIPFRPLCTISEVRAAFTRHG
ncbi:MAG TPA: orotate phosphoribosyltransferase [Gemmatimonadaceae bacterium]|nr:orotate phosphoribosyltransferase [Gemmatimonadaceae bacterium]